jgi:transcriptional regulator GlxA family with amidase domain
MKTDNKLSVAILVFDEVEVLDFTGPLEAFSAVNDVSAHEVHAYTLSLDRQLIACRSNLSIKANASVDTAYPLFDLIIIPGGMGVRKLLSDKEKLEKLKMLCERAPKVMSVCTGSLLLAEIGLLKGLKACTHHSCQDELRGMAPETDVLDDVRFCANKDVLTAGGISAGIDASLYLIEAYFGSATREAVAKEMEWPHYPPRYFAEAVPLKS